MSSGPNGRKDGLFLVRESYEQSGSFVLTLWALNQVRHFQIVGHGEKCFSIDNGPLLRGINDVMDQYKGFADCEYNMFPKLTAFVVGAPPPPWAVVKTVDTEYHKAVRYGDVGLLKRLLSQQFSTAYLNFYNPEGFTPVHIAANKGDVEVLLLLLEHKPDLNDTRDSEGHAAIHVS